MLGTYANRSPTGEYDPPSPRNIGKTSGTPPSRETVYSRLKSAYDSRPERNKIFFPSGVHPTATSSAGCHVNRFGSPPAAGTTYISALPSYSPVNAIHFPSGENTGFVSCPPVVNWCASPPSRGTLHKYPPYRNTISVLLIVSNVASNGASSAVIAIPEYASKPASKIDNRRRIFPPGQTLPRTKSIPPRQQKNTAPAETKHSQAILLKTRFADLKTRS